MHRMACVRPKRRVRPSGVGGEEQVDVEVAPNDERRYGHMQTLTVQPAVHVNPDSGTLLGDGDGLQGQGALCATC